MSEAGSAPEVIVHHEEAPSSIGGTLRRLGPGMIVAASIVGSGELIATTKTGAQAGFWLLWLIVIGCLIKVFVQVEFGRNAVYSGKTTMDALSEVPGPRLAGYGNWIVWYWVLMFLGSMGQLGGIVGGVGQAIAISIPLTDVGRDFNAFADTTAELKAARAALESYRRNGTAAERLAEFESIVASLETRERELKAEWETRLGEQEFRRLGYRPPPPPDDKIWAAVIALVTSWVLFRGKYGLIQLFSTAMVGAFTFVTLVNLGLLQIDPVWRVTASDIWNGLRFRLPPSDNAQTALATALATFGIIGVGASELVVYPYWCLEKGYGRFTGRFDGSDRWFERARGWLRVMQWDAWGSMVIYTLATVAFYLLGAAILGRAGLDPEKRDMIRTLAVMYEPVFGDWAKILFLFGSFAVLYSTYFVANASHARVVSDAIGVMGLARRDEQAHGRRVRILSGLFPLVCLAVYVAIPRPAQLVLLGALLQAVMLPMLAIAGLYFRYAKTPQPLKPGLVWDVFLWLSAAGMSIAGVWALVSKLQEMLAHLG